MRSMTWVLMCLFAMAQAYSQEDIPGSPSGQSSPFSQAKFVPDISLIVDGSYLDRNVSDDQAESAFLPGFGHHHAHDAPHEGFNLNYAEMSLYSVVDPYFDLFAVLHISAEHVHLEEAYWATRKLPAGSPLRPGCVAP